MCVSAKQAVFGAKHNEMFHVFITTKFEKVSFLCTNDSKKLRKLPIFGLYSVMQNEEIYKIAHFWVISANKGSFMGVADPHNCYVIKIEL